MGSPVQHLLKTPFDFLMHNKMGRITDIDDLKGQSNTDLYYYNDCKDLVVLF